MSSKKRNDYTEVSRKSRVKMHKSGKHWVRTVMSQIGLIQLGKQTTSEKTKVKLSPTPQQVSATKVLRGLIAASAVVGGGVSVDQVLAEDTVMATEVTTSVLVNEDTVSMSNVNTDSDTTSQSHSISESTSNSESVSQSISTSESVSGSESVSESEAISTSESVSASESALSSETASTTSRTTGIIYRVEYVDETGKVVKKYPRSVMVTTTDLIAKTTVTETATQIPSGYRLAENQSSVAEKEVVEKQTNVIQFRIEKAETTSTVSSSAYTALRAAVNGSKASLNTSVTSKSLDELKSFSATDLLIVESGYSAQLNYIRVGSKYVQTLAEAIEKGLTGTYQFNFTIIDNSTGSHYTKPDGQVDIVTASLSVTKVDSTSISQSISASESESKSISTSESLSNSISTSISESIIESVSESVSNSESLSNSILNSISESVRESVVESVSESVRESVVESVSESVRESVVESVSESVRESVVESLSESVSESVSESISESVSESISESVSESISESVSESISESVSESISESVSESISESVSESISESVS
ncbi:KxYKxGKxW signal peptide domain-containing protein, partial [Streptococcus suis]|uniref:KxYKxGKxW signal peptide domain-containing protein n=1 Tax=Streptococcus suis TaxID=1307 RepID=UPI0037568C78